jgi:hypothetical protein
MAGGKRRLRSALLVHATARNSIRCVLVAAVALALAATPAVGFADTLTHSDPAGDVQRQDFSSGETVVTDATHNTNVDIVRITIAHTTKRITAKVKVRDLAHQRWGFFSRIKASGRNYSADVLWDGDVTVRHQYVGPEIRCPNASASINHDKSTVAVRIPTACLKNPRWVRFASYLVRTPRHHAATTLDVDQAFAVGNTVDDRGHAVFTYSTRVRHEPAPARTRSTRPIETSSHVCGLGRSTQHLGQCL